MTELDIGIHCGYLITMAKGEAKVLRDYFIGIQKGYVKNVEPWKENKFKFKKFINAKDKAVMPGLINGHTHLAMSLFRGLADDQPFAEWLHDYILPLEAKLVDSEFVRIGTELSAMESIKSGVTTVCDMYYFCDQIAETLDKAGLRAVVGEGLADFATPDDKKFDGQSFRILEKTMEAFKDHERVVVCPGPHAPYTCGDETLKKAKMLSEKYNTPLLLHVAETQGEVDESLKKYSKTPMKRLYDLGFLGEKTCLAHCVCVSDEDIELLSKTKTSVVYNPESNMKLGSGVAPIPKMLSKGITVGLGTDGAASNNDISIFGEMDSGAKLQKLFHKSNTAMTAPDILKVATWSGAKALGLSEKAGSIEVGKPADVICLDLAAPHMQPIHNLVSQLVYSANGSEVETVICHGKILMENRELKTLDAEKIYSDVSKITEKINKSLS